MTFDWTQFFSRRSGNKQAPPPTTTTTTTATTISSTTTTIPPPSDELWDLVLDMDWSGVIEHAAEQPHNAQWQDGHWDETPLYLACQFHPPPDAIEAIIRAYPKAVTIPSRENHDLPIHLSCRYQAPIEVLEALIQDSPHTAVEQTRWGKTPLTVLWEFRPSSTSNNVTTTSTTTSLDDDVEFRSKVDLLLNAVARYRYDEQRRHQQHQQQLSSLECCDDTESKNDVGVDSIQSNNNYNNNSTTTTTTIHTTTEEEEYSFVHAAVSLGARCCPMEILEYVLRKYPTQISTRDRFDELPLHIILGPTSFSKATKRKYKPREQSFISRLLQIYPEAAKETAPIRIARSDSSSIDDDDGGNDDDDNNNIGQQTQVFRRYPLHIALSNRHCWFGGIQDLFLAGPDILLVQDPITKLYPFQLAAVPVGETTVDLDTIYHLLRSEPTVLSFCDDDSNNRKREREKNIIDDGNNKIIFSTKKEKEETITSKKPQAELSSPLTIQEVVVGIVTAMLLGYWATGSSHVTSE